MSGTVTANPPDWAPWRRLLKYAPFKIDALGLITLLGAEEINGSVGRLVRSKWLEYMPLLGAYVISGNRFRQKEPGFNLYNITEGIHTPDMAPWLTRWMQSQNFTTTRNFVRWTVVPPRHRPLDDFIAATISVCSVGMLFALTILSYDMYGVASTGAMGWSVLVRWYMLRSVREAIDDRVSEMCDDKHLFTEEETYEGRMKAWTRDLASSKASMGRPPTSDPEISGAGSLEEPHRLGCGWKTQHVKVLVVTSEALAVTMMIPQQLMGTRSPVNANLSPRRRFLYGVARWTGWIAFAVQVVTIGQADLVTQICTVGLLVIPTVLYVGKFGCDDSNWIRNAEETYHKCLAFAFPRSRKQSDQDREEKAWERFSPRSVSQIGSRLVAEVYEWPLNHDFFFTANGEVRLRTHQDPRVEERTARRQYLYAWLQLSDKEVESMDKWDLFPHGRDDTNKKWWADYRQLHALIEELSEPVGTIKGINSVPVIGAQDLADGMDVDSHSANGNAVEPSTSVHDNAPNGGAITPKIQSSSRVRGDENTDTAPDQTDEPQSPDEILMKPLPRTGTALTWAPSPDTSREHQEQPDGLSRRRRHSVSGGIYSTPPRDDILLQNSAFMATNMVRQERSQAQLRQEAQQEREEMTMERNEAMEARNEALPGDEIAQPRNEVLERGHELLTEDDNNSVTRSSAT